MHRKCKIQLKTLKPITMNLSIILIESNPEPQSGSTRGNSYPRGGPRGHGGGCNGRGGGCGSRQHPIDDAFADTSAISLA